MSKNNYNQEKLKAYQEILKWKEKFLESDLSKNAFDKTDRIKILEGNPGNEHFNEKVHTNSYLELKKSGTLVYYASYKKQKPSLAINFYETQLDFFSKNYLQKIIKSIKKKGCWLIDSSLERKI